MSANFLATIVYDAPRGVRLDLRQSVGKARLKTLTEIYLMTLIPEEEQDKFGIYRAIASLACFQANKDVSYYAGSGVPENVAQYYHNDEKPSSMEHSFYKMLDCPSGIGPMFMDLLNKLVVRLITDGHYVNFNELLDDLLNWDDSVRLSWERRFAGELIHDKK